MYHPSYQFLEHLENPRPFGHSMPHLNQLQIIENKKIIDIFNLYINHFGKLFSNDSPLISG